MCLACGGAAAAGPTPALPATEAVWLESNIRELYPRHCELCLSSYEQMSDTAGVVLRLQSDLEKFSHYRYALRRDSLPVERPKDDRSGAISLVFDSRNPQPQRIEAIVQAVSTTGAKTRPYSVVLGYYPREHYAASGQGSQNWLVVHTSDLELCNGSVEDWIVERPSPQDRAYARSRWGAMVRPLASNHDKARVIARDLVRSLSPHEGIPSGEMKYSSGFEQLARAERGEDHVWCGNYADIFSAACNSLDIPVRKIDMQYVWSSRKRTSFEIGEAHRTTEVFDRQRNRWIWMDLTLGYWGAFEEGGELLNMAELVQVLHDEQRIERLRLIEFDRKTGVERIVPVSESARAQELFRFFGRDQRYQYVRNSRTAVN